MLFGLALLAGLVGYAVVDPFSGADESANADTDTDVSGGATDTSGNILDDLDVTTDNPEVADGDPEVVADDPDTVVDDPDVVVEDPDTVITGTAEDDLIYGGDGDYTVNGGDGDDQLHGGDGSDILNGEAGNDELHAGDGVTGQSLNTLNGGDGDDQIHIRGHDTATGGDGADSFHYSTEYGDGALGTITDYDAADDQIVVEHMVDETSDTEVPPPEVSITVDGLNAVICLDGEECIVVQGAANSLMVEDILLRASPVI